MPSITVVAPLAAGAIYLSAFVPAGRAEPVRPAQVAAGTPTPTPVPTMTFNNGGNNPGGNNTFQGPVIQGSNIKVGLTPEEAQKLFELLLQKKSDEAERVAAEIKARQDAKEPEAIRIPIQKNATSGSTVEGDIPYEPEEGLEIAKAEIEWLAGSDGIREVTLPIQTSKKVVAHFRAQSVETKAGPVVVDTKNAEINAVLVVHLKRKVK